MPERSEKLQQLADDAGQYELPYISKSRVMQWIKNPEHFRLKYLEDIRPEETKAMRRGTDIHETFEEFYERAADYESAEALERAPELLGDRGRWADYTEPYITNFLRWEYERFDAAIDKRCWKPLAIEAEMWKDDVLGIDGEPEWMGIADVILTAESVPQVPDGEGAIIVDFKTGSVPDEKYRDDGIYTELEYYQILFDDEYDVRGAAAYYPREDELVVKPPDETEYRDNVLAAAEEMIHACADYDGSQQFAANEGPLCGWGTDSDERSDFYGVCSQCTWNVPVDNRNAFEQMVDEGYTKKEIAESLGCTTNAVGYWKYKLNL